MSGPRNNDMIAQSFNDMIQADRKKRKNQELAQALLGSGRRSSAPGGISNRKPGSPGSLANRVGVKKPSRPTSRSGINGPWTHDLHKPSALRRSHSPSRLDRGYKIKDAIGRDQVVNGSNPQAHIQSDSPVSLSIKGKANPGPFCVVATNFVPGTTAEDIEAAFRPHGDITSCKLLSTRPQITAELVFPKREHAENIVNTFNNSMADGRKLYAYVKPGPPSSIHNLEERAQAVVEQPTPQAQPPQDPKQEEQETKNSDVAMDIDDDNRRSRDPPSNRNERQDHDSLRSGRNSYAQDYQVYPRQRYEDRRDGFSDGYRRLPASYRPYYSRGPRYEERAHQGSQRWR